MGASPPPPRTYQPRLEILGGGYKVPAIVIAV
jgi:hypothetical protein